MTVPRLLSLVQLKQLQILVMFSVLGFSSELFSFFLLFYAMFVSQESYLHSRAQFIFLNIVLTENYATMLQFCLYFSLNGFVLKFL